MSPRRSTSIGNCQNSNTPFSLRQSKDVKPNIWFQVTRGADSVISARDITTRPLAAFAVLEICVHVEYSCAVGYRYLVFYTHR